MSLRLGSKGRVFRVLRKSMLLAQVAIVIATSAPAAAMLLGSGRQADAAGQFDGIGRLECADASRRGPRHMASAWVVGSADTIVTAAHLLFKQPSATAPEGRTLDPARCAFVLYDQDGRVRETVAIRYAVSRWSNEQLRFDSSYDLAVLKLDRPVKVANVPAVKVSHAIHRPLIHLAAFQNGIGDDNRLWLTAGQATIFPTNLQFDAVDGVRISKTGRMFATSADSTAGSSGGMYYDSGRKAAVGIHVGSVCAYVQARYDPDSCFNYGLRFDAKMIRMIASVAADSPDAEHVIRPSLDAAALQMALLDAPRP